MAYKMLVINMDGTLMQDNGRIHKSTREAVEYALQKGIHITLASSKIFPSVKRTAKALKLKEHMISHGGAFIAKDVHTPIYANRINEEMAHELAALLESFQCQIKMANEKMSVANKINVPANMMAKFVIQSATRFSYQEKYVELISESLLDTPFSPNHIEVTFFKEKEMKDAIQAMKGMYIELEWEKTAPLKLRITAAGVSKLNGIEYVCSHYGIRQEEVVAIGSELDDLEVITWAGLGVAMGNAPRDVLEAADWVTRGNNDNGVAYMVKEHFRKQHRLNFLDRIK